MSDAVTVRRATEEDLEAIGRLWQEMMDYHCTLDPNVFALAEDALSCWREWLDTILSEENRVVLVAEVDGKPVGYVHGTVGETPPVYAQRKHGAIVEISVTASWRRRGVGGKLIAALFDWFRQRGLAEVRMGRSPRNPLATAFWRKMGFEPYMVQMRRELEERRSE
jgi:ribosomal protein S18 acetylase RimI-like enzyme